MATYQTVNGPKTEEQMNAELNQAGWGGATYGDQASINQQIVNAYAQTTGGAVTPGGMTAVVASPTSTIAPATTVPNQNQAAAALGAQIQGLLAAQAAGNKQAFDEMVRQFNATFGLQQDQFNESIRQYNQNLAVSAAGLTGQYAGQTTLQNQLQQANLAAQQAGLTGYYSAPTVMPTSADFFKQTAADQQAWTQRFGGNTTQAAEQWAIQAGQRVAQYLQENPNATSWSLGAASGVINRGPATPTLAAQNQWAQLFGSNAAPTAGQETLASQLQYAQQLGTYQGQQTLAAALQAANIAAQRNQTAQNWASLYGYTPQVDANGNPVMVGTGTGGGGAAETLAAQQQRAQQLGVYEGQQTLAAQQQQYAQQMGMINQAAQLQANPFRQQQAIGQMNRLLGGQGVAGFQAPTTVQGVGTAGGNTQGGLGYLNQMIEDIRNPAANTASMNEVLQGIPTPNKLNSVEFLRSAPSTQNLVLQGMQEKFGLDPNDALAQIKNTLPTFQAPRTFGQVGR